MFCDFHTHVLPEIDDGAKNLEMSLQMLKLLKKQGADVVAATPHYYAHKQSIADFCQKRGEALSRIADTQTDGLPEIAVGAEVYLERGIKREDLHPLCIQNTSYILIEMPYMHYASWMLEEVYQLSIEQSLIPIFAHLDRYYTFYSKDDIQEILDFDDAIVQVNHSALFTHKGLKTVLNWIKEGYPIITGSDCHDLSSRAPDDKDAISVLKSKMGKPWMEEYSSFISEILKGK